MSDLAADDRLCSDYPLRATRSSFESDLRISIPNRVSCPDANHNEPPHWTIRNLRRAPPYVHVRDCVPRSGSRPKDAHRPAHKKMVALAKDDLQMHISR